MLNRKMDNSPLAQTVHFAALFLIRFQILSSGI